MLKAFEAIAIQEERDLCKEIVGYSINGDFMMEYRKLNIAFAKFDNARPEN